MKEFILFCMVFFHVVDDYYLQGCLANMKQKSWWRKNVPGGLYSRDYLMALAMHSFSWSFMIMLPLTVYFLKIHQVWFPALYAINAVIHFIVDDAKANKMKISLAQDQLIHLMQVVLTWAWCFMVHIG